VQYSPHGTVVIVIVIDILNCGNPELDTSNNL